MTTLSEYPGCNPLCRACHYKDLDYPNQILKKTAWAEKCLGEWSGALRPIREAPTDERIGYRAKSWMRTDFLDGELAFGFFRAKQLETCWGKEFIDWRTCPIHHPAIPAVIANLGPKLARHPAFLESLFGVWFGIPDLVLVGKDPLPDEIKNLDWNRILVPPFKRVGFHQTSQVGRTVFGGGPISRVYSPEGESVESAHPIGAFRQIARTLVDAARVEARKALLETRPSLVLDLYCGTGELALGLPESVGWIGIESTRASVQQASSLRSGPAIHVAYSGLIEDRLRDAALRSKIPPRYSLYLNPPRPGLEEKGREVLAGLLREKPPESVAYLSCSASSLARDLRVIEGGGYRVESLQPYDFFPQTEHFETLAILKLEKSPLR